MHKFTAREARSTLGAVLDLVAGGEEVVITRHGRAVARLMPAAKAFYRTRAENVACELMQVSRGLSLGGLAVKQLVDEGRE
jgi:prevent-host-death family protein